MKFFNSRIVTSNVNLEDAVKKASATEPKAARSLDDMIADLEAQNEQVKTAGSETNVKTATADAVKDSEPTEATTEVKVEVGSDLKKEAAGIENIPPEKRAKPFGKDSEEDGEAEEAKCAEEGKKEDKEASGNKTLKVAKKIDFRNWEAEDVVKAWNQHGSVEACMKNVEKSTDNPKIYCGLLQVASKVAQETLEKHAKKDAASKTAGKKTQQKSGTWKVLAKLTDKEHSMLDKYWRKLYGDYYVDAMLSDY